MKKDLFESLVITKLTKLNDNQLNIVKDIGVCKKDIALVKQKVENHLIHQEKSTNLKIKIVTIIVGSVSGIAALIAIFK